MHDAAPDIPTLDEVREAAARLAPYIVRTPLIRLNHDGPPQIYLKLENLQPIGAFKVRPVGNAVLSADRKALKHGVYTASSGNSGLALAWIARHAGLDATVYAPESAPQGKLEAIRRYGGKISRVSDDEWWRIIENGGDAAEAGFYVDAVRNRAALAGVATLGLEILEQLPGVDTVIAPFGGGGAVCGIAAAISALKPATRIVAAETEAAEPLTAAFATGRPVQVPTATSFISGVGAPSVLPEMWPVIRRLVHRTAVVPVADVAEAIRMLFLRNRIVVEGAGAISVAAALGGGDEGTTVCIVTGGNIDAKVFCSILNGAPLDTL